MSDLGHSLQATARRKSRYVWNALTADVNKGKEAWPNNDRLPPLTVADDHPGEDLPRFRYALRGDGARLGRAGGGRLHPSWGDG
jgi:hypothetical protein